MALDTWIEQDIRTFLDEEAQGRQYPQPARMEDSASIVSGHNWSNEIVNSINKGDVEHAKIVFNQLRTRYAHTPQSHDVEKQKLYEMLQSAYIEIANTVMEKYRTAELLRRMELSPGDIFDNKIKPIDLTNEEQIAQKDLPDYTPFTKDNIQSTSVFDKLGTISHVSPEDALSFDPEALLKANKELSERVDKAEKAASVIDETIKDLMTALRLALTDAKQALVAIDSLLAKPQPPDVRAAAAELRSAIVEREEMIAFNAQITKEIANLEILAQNNDSLTAPTGQRLANQIETFARQHKNYPEKHKSNLISRINQLVKITNPITNPTTITLMNPTKSSTVTKTNPQIPGVKKQ